MGSPINAVTFSIITPVIRAHTLRRMLGQLIPQLIPRDEVLIIGDGPQPECREVTESYKNPCLKYWDMIPPPKNWGNPQRNDAIKKALGTHIVFIDDDDQVHPNGLEMIRSAVAPAPHRPHMFKMFNQGNLIWRTPDVALANVSGQMFIAPNIKNSLGTWSKAYAADFDFINSTLSLYPEGHNAVVWRKEIPIIQGLGGV